MNLPEAGALVGRIDSLVDGVFIPGGLWDGGLLFPGGPPDPVPRPKFDRTDLWMRDARFRTAVTPHEAYVTGGELVASFESLVLPLRIDGDRKMFDMELENATVVATLSSDASGGATLSGGVLAGTWRATKLLEQVRMLYVDVPGVTGFVCDSPLFFEEIRSRVCRRSELNADPHDTSAACNAVSVGVGFDAYALAEPGPFYSDARQFRAADAGAKAVRRADERCGPGAAPAGATCSF